MELEMKNNVTKGKNNKEIKSFVKDLEGVLEKNDKKEGKGRNNTQDKTISKKELDRYWLGTAGDYIFDIAPKEVGLSLMTTEKKYGQIKNTVEDVLKEISKTAGPIYYKEDYNSRWNEELQKECYYVDKYENGKQTESLYVPKEEKLDVYGDLIFVYDKKNKPQIRNDLKKEAIKLTKERLANLKKDQDKKVKEYKKEGHIYNITDEGDYIIIKDTTQRKVPIEDMEFSIKDFKGNGKYQVINGEYKKVGEFIERESKENKERNALIEELDTIVDKLIDIGDKEIEKQLSTIDKKDKNGILYNLMKNIIPIPKQYERKLNSLIRDALESESMHNEISYITYDKKTNTYYLDTYNEAERSREKISKKVAEEIGIGMTCFKDDKNKIYGNSEQLSQVMLGLWEGLADEKHSEDLLADSRKKFNRIKNA